MISKHVLVVCLLFLVTSLCVDAQRENRRRTGRRKPTTESPSPSDIEPEIEKSPQKVDSEPPESIAKPASIDTFEPESNVATPIAKDNANQSGPPFILPRGTRKPRPMQMRTSRDGRPKPTLPTFTRKSSGRMHKAERHEFKKNEASGVSSSSTSTTTTTKPSRNSSRRRNGGQQSPSRNAGNSEKSSRQASSPKSETSTEAAPKKRFGGGSRRPSRGGRRSTTAAPEAQKL